MNQVEFIALGARRVLADWVPVAMSGQVPRLLALLSDAGYEPGDVLVGQVTAAGATLGNYLCVGVSDPLLGSFVVRLHLLVHWDAGAELIVNTFRAKDAVAPIDPHQVLPGALGTVVVAYTDMDWDGLSREEAVARMAAWHRRVLDEAFEEALARQLPELIGQMDGVLAP